jgi:hypothetical protein
LTLPAASDSLILRRLYGRIKLQVAALLAVAGLRTSLLILAKDILVGVP